MICHYLRNLKLQTKHLKAISSNLDLPCANCKFLAQSISPTLLSIMCVFFMYQFWLLSSLFSSNGKIKSKMPDPKWWLLKITDDVIPSSYDAVKSFTYLENFIGAIYPPRFIVKVKEGTLLCPFPTVINNKKSPETVSIRLK